MHDQMIRLREHPELIASACTWFHEKWWIPESAYRESMEEMTAQKATAAEIAATKMISTIERIWRPMYVPSM